MPYYSYYEFIPILIEMIPVACAYRSPLIGSSKLIWPDKAEIHLARESRVVFHPDSGGPDPTWRDARWLTLERTSSAVRHNRSDAD